LTINKAQGYTIHNVAVEISPDSSPWGSGQVIVTLSRTRRASDTIIVGQDIDWVKNKLWNVLCTPTQCFRFEECILALITLNQDDLVPQLLESDFHRVNPFRVRDILIPTKSVGYVYIIIPKSNTNFTYIGQTKNISQRLDIHNRSHGAVDTAVIERRPYALAGLISSVGLDNSVGMALEQKWRVLHKETLSYNDSPYVIVKLGESIAQFHNQYLYDNGEMQQCVWQCFLEDYAV
jgi:predicted GIY-YIG superfamily endonuclease